MCLPSYRRGLIALGTSAMRELGAALGIGNSGRESGCVNSDPLLIGGVDCTKKSTRKNYV